jgi:hypothetical protein
MKEWTKERCSEEPQELQLVADGIYIQRKNIERVQHEATEGMEAYADWECDSGIPDVGIHQADQHRQGD